VLVDLKSLCLETWLLKSRFWDVGIINCFKTLADFSVSSHNNICTVQYNFV